MTPDVLVIGGGPSGSAAAIVLARGGAHVTLIEREAAAREKVCGEFLGADAAAALATLGLDLPAMGAVPIARAQVAHRGGSAGFTLPFAGWSLPRSILDEALLTAASQAGVTLRRGLAVREVAPDASAWRLRLADGAELRAPRVVLATGKHALRGFPRVARREWLGAKLHLRLAAPLEAVTLLRCAGGYAGLQPGPDGLANLCAALTDAAPARDAESFVAHVAAGSPLGAALLAGSRPAMARPLAIARVPYGFLHCEDMGAASRLWRVGDQFAVIPSFCGDGMAMALAGGIAAARAILRGQDAAVFHAAWRDQLRPAMRLAGATAFVLHRAPALFSGTVAAAPGLARFIARATRVSMAA